ncbi:MAG: hypothetical protein ACLFTR_04745, partial [Candidatus Woesearchaeota archaeon]
MGAIMHESLLFFILTIFPLAFFIFKSRYDIKKMVLDNKIYLAVIFAFFLFFFIPHLHFDLYPEGTHIKYENALLYDNPEDFVPPRTHGGIHLMYYPFISL